MAAQGVLRTIDGDRKGFWCPGCKEVHVVGPSWGFNENWDRPTFTPSVLVRGTKPLTEDQYQAVMRGEKIEVEPYQCHSFVEDGQIRFLDDCTHDLKNSTVPLEPWLEEDILHPENHAAPDSDPNEGWEQVPEFKQDADGNDIVDDDGNKIPDPNAKTMSGAPAWREKVEKPTTPATQTDDTTFERTIVGSNGTISP